MNAWSAGYVSDIGYTFGYYHELNPLRIKLAFLNSGLVPPRISSACELGFGQGVSINFHSAASDVQWHGTDFNPAQAAFAQELADISGTGVVVRDEAFDQFAARGDSPEFDFICLHGIWSWISDHNRAVIVDFIKSKLKVGGVLYISYNTMPGWASFAPMRHLMTEHAEVIGSQGKDIASKIDDSIEFAEQMLGVNPLFSQANPSVTDRVARMKGMSRHYLAHEYFNKDWHPMHFADLGDWLTESKVSFACSANYLDHIDGINLTTQQAEFLATIPNPMFRQSVRDFVVNQQFRKDYWVKGLRKLSNHERNSRLRETRVILAANRNDVKLTVNGAIGEASMSEAIYAPILDYLANNQIVTISQIEQAVVNEKINFQHITEALMILTGAGHVHPANEDDVIKACKDTTKKVNRHLCEKSRGSGDFTYLVSPVTGGGLIVSRFEQLFILALELGIEEQNDWASFAWENLKEQAQKILSEGKVLETEDENLKELQKYAKEFSDKRLKLLKALQIV